MDLVLAWIAALVTVTGLVVGDLRPWEPFASGVLGATVLSVVLDGAGEGNRAHADS